MLTNKYRHAQTSNPKHGNRLLLSVADSDGCVFMVTVQQVLAQGQLRCCSGSQGIGMDVFQSSHIELKLQVNAGDKMN